jgi:flagellar biosynthetic protein FliR
VNISLVQVFGALLTIGVRLTGIMLFAPFFGSSVIQARLKAMLVITLTALLYPMLATKIPYVSISQWPMMVFSELLIGIALGVATNIVFDGVQMAGQVLSVQMGYSLVSILDPQTLAESTVVATFHQTVAMLIFLRLNVHLWILRALAGSVDYLPPASGHLGGPFVAAVLRAGGGVFTIGVQIAAPVLSATLFTDIALGLLGKASPQLPLMLLGPAVKSVLGILVLISALKYWPDLFATFFLRSILTADRFLHLAR